MLDMPKEPTIRNICFYTLLGLLYFQPSAATTPVQQAALKNAELFSLALFTNPESFIKRQETYYPKSGSNEGFEEKNITFEHIFPATQMLEEIINFFRKIKNSEANFNEQAEYYLDLLLNLKRFLFIKTINFIKNEKQPDQFIETACKFINIQYQNMIIFQQITQSSPGDDSETLSHIEAKALENKKVNREVTAVLNNTKDLVEDFSAIFLQKKSSIQHNALFYHQPKTPTIRQPGSCS
jgi:hypothetical protein